MGTEHRDAFYARGHALRANGRSDLAAREFEQAIGVDPNHARSYAMLALCRCDTGAHDRAVDAAQTALSLDPSDPFVRRSMGWALLGAGRPSDAVAHALESLQIEPSSYDGVLLVGEGLYQSRNYVGAFEAAEQAVRLRPDAAGGHRLRSSAARMLSRLDESRAAAETAIRLEPDSFWSHVVLARVALAQRDVTTAAAAYREALRLSPSNAESREGLVSALKVRRRTYRWLTDFHRWFFRLSSAKQTLVVFGIAIFTFGFGLLPFAVLVCFGSAADPLADFILRFDRYGRQLLTPERIRRGDTIAVLISALIAGIVGAVESPWDGAFWVCASVAASAVSALRAVNCRPGRSTWIASAYVAVVLAASIMAVVPWSMAPTYRPIDKVMKPAWEGAAFVAALAAFVGVYFSGRIARSCGYPWSHRFDAPSR